MYQGKSMYQWNDELGGFEFDAVAAAWKKRIATVSDTSEWAVQSSEWATQSLDRVAQSLERRHADTAAPTATAADQTVTHEPALC